MKKNPPPFRLDPDGRDVAGITLLMEAASRNLVGKVRECIERGSDVNLVDKSGWDALLHAVHGSAEEAAAMLIFHGANVKHVTPRHYTALMQACQRQMHGVIERLVTGGAPLDMQEDEWKYTALMTAITHRDIWAACRLVTAGADTGTLKDKKGNTALDLARVHFDPDDRAMFDKVLGERRDQVAAAERCKAEAAARQLAQDVQEATVLQDSIKPLKPVAFRPKAR